MTTSPTQTTFDGKRFWLNHAPDFNFELNEAEIIARGLERNFIVKVEGSDDLYTYVTTD